MRVTNSMLAGNFLRDMRSNLENMRTLQNQLTSGKEIRKPSDDPFKVARAMQLHSDIDSNKQYNENIKDTINWMDTTDTALNQAGNVLQRVRELIVSSGNAGYGSSERKAIKDEINEKIGEFSQIMNTNFDGKYIFAGTRGGFKPVDVTKDATSGNSSLTFIGRDGNPISDDSGNPLAGASTDQLNQLENIKTKVETEISQGVTVEYNVTATEVFSVKDKKGNEKNLMDIFKAITNNLDGKDANGVSDTNAINDLTSKGLQDITDAMDNLLRIRSTVGAKQNRMDSAKDKNEEENFNMTDILSKTEDIDMTQKVMEYSTMQTVYTASLQTSAKVLQPSLLDYLR